MLFYFACEAAGASSARHSLRPLIFRRANLPARLAHMRGEIAEVCPTAASSPRTRPRAGDGIGRELAGVNSCDASASRPAPHCRSKLLRKFGEFVGGEIADRPIVQASLAPASDVESLKALGPGRTVLGAGGLRHEQVDDMQAPAVNERADRVRFGIG